MSERIDWAYTPEGHDDEYEYVATYDCDGTLVAYSRRTPRRVIDAGAWEIVESLPPVSTRSLVGAGPGEEPRA